jgi:hypothetical protein
MAIGRTFERKIMDYELAQQLKGASFPQQDGPDERLFHDGEGGFV